EAQIASGELAAYKAELGTKPHVLYKHLYKYTKNFVSAGVLVNGDCFEGATAVIKGENREEAQTTNFFGEFKFDNLDDGKYTITIEGAGKTETVDIVIEGKSLNLGFIEL
ncbi:MAG: oxidoreductase, partial [Oscillospiraceae bacterium]|nr:oxidoreductase [Oscillospiraceae bacterium]